jgi:2-dehydropantoate 2-reductase
MRQVPHYLLIGNGRVAKHFRYYFSQLKLSFSCWQRNDTKESLREKISSASHILLLINDHAIGTFFKDHLQNTSAICVHFSGSFVSEHIYGAHPLMTFAHHLYPLEVYHTIPFILEETAPPFVTLLPQLSNPAYRLQSHFKNKYHALCVMAGNFSCLLWQKLFAALEQWGLPKEAAQPFLLQQVQNLIMHPKTALTGPLTRGDQLTIERHLTALGNDNYRVIYQSFVNCYQKNNSEE